MARQVAVDALRHADGIGIGQQYDLAGDAALCVGRVQEADQVVQGQQPRPLVGMECGVQVGLGPGTRLAVTMRLEKSPGPRARAGESPGLGLARVMSSVMRGIVGSPIRIAGSKVYRSHTFGNGMPAPRAFCDPI